MLPKPSTSDIQVFLGGGDVRSLGKSHLLVRRIRNQQDFDQLFVLVFHHDRVIAARAADVCEKVTRAHPEYLQNHQSQFFLALKGELQPEVKWHLVQMASRMTMTDNQAEWIGNHMLHYAVNPSESRIVRVNALQGLADMAQNRASLLPAFRRAVGELRKCRVPSIAARIRKLNEKSKRLTT